MNQPKQPQGNFVLNLNFKRNTNPKAPAITGRVSTPEDPETEFNYSAFQQVDKNGEIYWIGPVDMSRSVRQALNSTALRGTHFVSIRENGFKVFKELPDGTPNPAYAKLSPEQQEHADNLPAYWGSWTRTATDPQLRLAAWEREPTRYGPWASGNTQHPISKEQAAALKADQPDADFLNAPEPKRTSSRRAKADDRERS